MQNLAAKEVTCDFESKRSLNRAVQALEKHAFNRDDMGIEKVAEEYTTEDDSSGESEEGNIRKEPWRVRDSIHDIAEQNHIQAGVIVFVGLGLLLAAIVAAVTLDKIGITQELVLFVLLMAIGLILGGAGIGAWMIRDTKQQFKEQYPEKLLRFWVRTPDEQSKKEAIRILDRYGGQHIREQHSTVHS